MGAVVSDTSVLNYLARLGRSALLRDQFGHVIVPEAVLTELDNRPDLPGAGCVRQAVAEGWMEIAAPENVAMVTLLREHLGFDESQAIVLAMEHAAACVLIDEAEGRQRAAALGIPVVGTVGVLLRAKHDGVIRELSPRSFVFSWSNMASDCTPPSSRRCWQPQASLGSQRRKP